MAVPAGLFTHEGGIQIPALQLQSQGDTHILLVHRFDREKRPQGWVRKGFLSSLALLQWDEGDQPVASTDIPSPQSPVGAREPSRKNPSPVTPVGSIL